MGLGDVLRKLGTGIEDAKRSYQFGPDWRERFAAAQQAAAFQQQRAMEDEEDRQYERKAKRSDRERKVKGEEFEQAQKLIDANAEALVAGNPELDPSFNGPPDPDAAMKMAVPEFGDMGGLTGAQLQALVRARAKTRQAKGAAEEGKLAMTLDDREYGREKDAKAEARNLSKDELDERVKLATLALAQQNAARKGEVDPNKFDKDRFRAADTLRDDFERRYKPYQDVGRSMNVIKTAAADPTGAKDIALVTTFMKMLDPGSTVRESEFATAQNTGAMWEKLKAKANELATGEKLSAEQRSQMASAAQQFADSTMKDAGKIRKNYEELAGRRGLDPREILVGFGGEDEPPPTPGPSRFKVTPAGAPAQTGTASRFKITQR